MRSLCLSLLLLLFIGSIPSAENWVGEAAPPDKETTDAYKAGTISPRQEELAEVFLELADKYVKLKKTREVKDALRRAQMFHPDSQTAEALYDKQTSLPAKPKEYTHVELSKEYKADLKKLQFEQTEALLEVAEMFAQQTMPLACQYALEQARQGNVDGKKKVVKQIAEKTDKLQQVLAKHPLRIHSYNLLYPGGTDITDKDPAHWDWAKRRPLHDDVIRVTQPDIIGIQEISSWQPFLDQSWADMFKMYRLKDFTGQKKGNDADCAIYYNFHRFEIVEKGYRHLNRWNDITKKKSDWGASSHRQLGWVRFRDFWTGNQFYFFNTHTAWPGESYKGDDGTEGTTDDLHEEQIGVCMQELEKVNRLLPLFFTGDFNNRGGHPWRMLCEEGPFDVEKSYRCKAFGIDWILCSHHWEPTYRGTVYSKKGDVRASDHLTPIGYYKYPDPEPLKAAWEAEPTNIEALDNYLRVLVISKQEETRELLKDQLKKFEKEQRGPLLWLQAEIEEGFGEAKLAAKYFKSLMKLYKKDERGPEATYCYYRVLANNELASKSDIKAMQKFADDEEKPRNYREKIANLPIDRSFDRPVTGTVDGSVPADGQPHSLGDRPCGLVLQLLDSARQPQNPAIHRQ
jgi:hypothetical protein